MDMLWPGFLALLILIPLAVLIYVWRLRRVRVAVRYSSLSLVREALPRYSWLRRHLPFILLMLALTSLTLALTRPITIITVPTDKTTVILTIDVSRSMCSTDIQPNRLQAAEAAASQFVENQQSRTQIGIVAFSGFAEVIQAPTTDQEVLLDAIESLTTGRRTAVGSAILKAIDAIAEVDTSVAATSGSSNADFAPTPVPKGAYAPDIIILLTDGASNAGVSPVDAAQAAADRGIRVYTIGFGTANPTGFPNCGQQFIGGEPFQGGGGQGPGGGFRRGIDEDTLKQIASITGGEYYSAESAHELQNVFQNLPTYLIARHEIQEISFVFTALGALFAVVAVLLSVMWRPLP